MVVYFVFSFSGVLATLLSLSWLRLICLTLVIGWLLLKIISGFVIVVLRDLGVLVWVVVVLFRFADLVQSLVCIAFDSWACYWLHCLVLRVF